MTGVCREPTVDRLLDWWADHHPERVAHVVPGVAELTYGQWRRRCAIVAANLHAHGVTPGSTVALAFPRGAIIEFAVCLAAVHRVGAVAVLLPADENDEDIARLLAACLPDLLVSPRAVGDLPALTVEQLSVPAEARASAPVSSHTEATVVFTSGTTGTPKAVAICHGDLVHGVAPDAFADEPAGTLLHSFPLSVPVGQWAAQAPLLRGLRVVTMGEFTPLSFVELVSRYQATETAMVPAMATMLRDLPAAARSGTASMRRVTIGSARCPEPALRVVREVFPAATVVIDYSSTESGWAGTTIEYGDGYQPGTVGGPNPGCRVRIVADDGAELPAGAVGNVELRLPPGIPPRRYLHDPVATAMTFRGRWVRMADLGHLDDDGVLQLTARTKDVVDLSGRKVSCPEVEQVFESHPNVVEAAAYPVADPILGEELGLAVVTDTAVQVAELRRHAAAHLSAHKVPSHITVVTTLPRTRSGKVRKSELARLVAPAVAGSDVDTVVGQAVLDVLGLAVVPWHRSLAELGASSIQVIRIYHRITAALSVEFDVVAMFDDRPLSALAGSVAAA